MPDDYLLTVPEVMDRLKLSRSKVYDLIRTNRLTSVTEGRCRRVPPSAVSRYIANLLDEAA